jgi:hypothetical protein
MLSGVSMGVVGRMGRVLGLSKPYGEEMTDIEKTAVSAEELIQKIKIEARKQGRFSDIDFDVKRIPLNARGENCEIVVKKRGEFTGLTLSAFYDEIVAPVLSRYSLA